MRFETFLYVCRITGVNPIAFAKQHVDVMRHAAKLKLLDEPDSLEVLFHGTAGDKRSDEWFYQDARLARSFEVKQESCHSAFAGKPAEVFLFFAKRRIRFFYLLQKRIRF